ncbi:hypothetical protein WDU94_014935 [Cyamophila willieti]
MKPAKTATRNLAIEFDKIEVDQSAPTQPNNTLNLTVENLMLFDEINEISNEPRDSFFDKKTLVARTENEEHSPRASSHGSSLFFEHLFNEKYGSDTKPTNKKEKSPDTSKNITTRRPARTKTKIMEKDSPPPKPGRKKVPTPDFLKSRYEECIIEIKSSGSDSPACYPTKALTQSYQFSQKLKKHTPPKRQTKSLTQPQRKAITPRSSIRFQRKSGPRNSNANKNLFDTDSSDEIASIANRKPSLALSPIPRVREGGVASSATQARFSPIKKPSQPDISIHEGTSRIPSTFHRIGSDHSRKPINSRSNFSPTSLEISKDINSNTQRDCIINSTSNSNSLKDDSISLHESDRTLETRLVGKPSDYSTTHSMDSAFRALENPCIPNTSRQRRKSSSSDTLSDESNPPRPKDKGPRHSISSNGSLLQEIVCAERIFSSKKKPHRKINSPKSKTKTTDQVSTFSTVVIPVLSPARDHESFHTAISSPRREPSPVLETVLSPQFFSPPMYIWDDPGYEDNMILPNEDAYIPKPASSHTDSNMPTPTDIHNENTEDAKELAPRNSNSHISVDSLGLSNMEQQNVITTFHEKLSSLSQPLENSQFLKKYNEYFGHKSSSFQQNQPDKQSTVVEKSNLPSRSPRSPHASNSTAVLQNMHLSPDVIINQPEGAMEDSSSDSVWGQRSKYYQHSNRNYSDKPVTLHSDEDTQGSVQSPITFPNLRDTSKPVTDSNQTVLQPNSPEKLFPRKQNKGKEREKCASVSSSKSETCVSPKMNFSSHPLSPFQALRTSKDIQHGENTTFTKTSRSEMTNQTKTSKYSNMSPSSSDKDSLCSPLQTHSSDDSNTHVHNNSLIERNKLEMANKTWLRTKTTQLNPRHSISNSLSSDSECPRTIKKKQRQDSSLSDTESDDDRHHNVKMRSPRFKAKRVSCSQPASFKDSISTRQSISSDLERRLQKTKTEERGYELEEIGIEGSGLSFSSSTAISSLNAESTRALNRDTNPKSQPTPLSVRKSLNFDQLLEESLHINESYVSRLETQHRSTITPSNATRSPSSTTAAVTSTRPSTTVTRTPASTATVSARSSVLDTTGVTPLADYSIMETPLLKKELNKYGLKPNLGKAKAKLLLRYIYNQTHPYVDSTEESSENTSKPQPKRRKTNPTASKLSRNSDNIPPSRKTKPTSSEKQSENSDSLPLVKKRNPRAKQLENPANVFPDSEGSTSARMPHINETSSSSRVLPVSKAGETDRVSKRIPNILAESKETLPRQRIEPPVSSSDGLDSSDSESSVPSMTEPCVYEESILFEHNINTSPPSSQTTGGQNFLTEVDRILRSPDNYRKILRYEPIWLEHLHSNLKQRGVRCNVKQLMDYLDEKCITFRTIRQKPRVRQKPTKSNKRRPAEQEGGVTGPSTSRARQYSSQPVTSSRRGR